MDGRLLMLRLPCMLSQDHSRSTDAAWHSFSHPDIELSLLTPGFMHNHARLNGLWGYGTYYSTTPSLALTYEHNVSSTDEGMQNGSHSFGSTKDLKQMIAVDVLTGKAKQLAQDKTLRMPPMLEDGSIGRYAKLDLVTRM